MKNPPGLIFRNRIVWHILFWLLCYLFYSVTYGSYAENYRQEFISNLYLLPVRIAGTYAFIYYLIPVFLLGKRYLAFSVLAIVHAVLFGLALWAVLNYFVYCDGCIYEPNYPLFSISKIFRLIIGNYEIPAIAALIVITKRWYVDQQITREMEKDKLEAELKFLKSQIHPHFLFNTLNNLYALTLIKSDKAPDVVIRLSEMLNYMLYHSNEKEVKLIEEIDLLKAYLELEKIRYGNRLNLSFKLQGDPENKYLAPLLLLPFVENSFKHGVSNNVENPFIRIDLQITDDALNLQVVNSFGEQSQESFSEGIGLKNVQRRLDILYKDRYNLQVKKNDGIFEVSFRLNWSANS
jgi:two-component system LytT family sensor kinase